MVSTLAASAGLVGVVLPEHLGSLHPVEQALTLALAFGPFLVLGVVVAVRRRQDAAPGAPEGERRGDGPDGSSQPRGSRR